MLITINLAGSILAFKYYSAKDFFLFCVPNLVVVNIISLCICSVVFKTNAYIFILSTELWLKMKRFNIVLKSIEHSPNQHIFSKNLEKSFYWFIYNLTLNQDYNRFWLSQFSILIIWRSMVITFISYIIFFNQLPSLVLLMYTLMWTMEQIVLVLLLIQVTNVVALLNTSSQTMKKLFFHKNSRSLQTKLKVCSKCS